MNALYQGILSLLSNDNAPATLALGLYFISGIGLELWLQLGDRLGLGLMLGIGKCRQLMQSNCRWSKSRTTNCKTLICTPCIVVSSLLQPHPYSS